MGIEEQKGIKKIYFNEALRYMNNANDNLKKAGKDGKYYIDDKYVKSACGIAYSGILKALDGYLLLKGVERKKGRKSIEYYVSNTAKLDKKLMNDLNTAYEVLHLSGYYDGATSVPLIKVGFDTAYDIINRIEP